MKSVAIIGTGIAGMACGYFLHSRYDIRVYERNDYAGGQVHSLGESGVTVYNETAYPELTRLFTCLQVPTQPIPMSLSVQHLSSGVEFGNSGWNARFAQRKNLLRPRFWRFLGEIRRFQAQAPIILDDLLFQEHSVRNYVQDMGHSQDFVEKYLLPLSSMLWPTAPEVFLEGPAVTWVKFFNDQGFLSPNKPLAWRTCAGSGQTYRVKLIQPFRDHLHLGRAAVRITRRPGAVQVIDSVGDARSFDGVILACHADEALALLTDPSPEERALLGAIRYQKSSATLHTDASIMPRTRRAWCSWNYRYELDAQGQPTPSMTCWINRIQSIPGAKDYFVSTHADTLDPSGVLKTTEDAHPLCSWAGIRAQKDLPKLNENGTTYFCGRYFGFGTHEDALVSALAVCKKLNAMS